MQRQAQALRPEARRQSVWRVVGKLNRFFGVTKAERDQYGAEDFFLRYSRRRRDPAEQRRREKAPLVGQLGTGLKEIRAFCNTGLDKLGDAIALRLVDQRAHVNGLIERIADPQLGHA